MDMVMRLHGGGRNNGGSSDGMVSRSRSNPGTSLREWVDDTRQGSVAVAASEAIKATNESEGQAKSLNRLLVEAQEALQENLAEVEQASQRATLMVLGSLPTLSHFK